MALVDSHRYDEQLHGTIEMIEDSSQMPPAPSKSHIEVCSKTLAVEDSGLDQDGTNHKKDDIVLVTVKPLTASSSSSQHSVPTAKSEAEQDLEHTTSIDEGLLTNQEAGRRRYSVMMASLASAQVEASKAALRSNDRASPGDSTGASSDTAIGGWKWQHRRDLEDDFSMRERYFAEEL